MRQHDAHSVALRGAKTPSGKLRRVWGKTRKELAAYEVPAAAPPRDRPGIHDGRLWSPIHHKDLADAVVTVLEGFGFGIWEEVWGVCQKDDHAMVGAVTFDLGDAEVVVDGEHLMFEVTDGGTKLELPDGCRFHFGVRHSNNAYWALSALIGLTDVSTNAGLVFDDFTISRRHTEALDLVDTITETVKRYLIEVQVVLEHREALVGYAINEQEGNSLIVELARAGAFPWRLVQYIADQWQANAARTLWSLYLAVTIGVRRRKLEGQLQTVMDTSRLLVMLAGDSRGVARRLIAAVGGVK